MTQINQPFCWNPFPTPEPRAVVPDPLLMSVLRPGNRHEDVRVLQRALRSAGYDLEIDGFLGRVTLECVRSFQATHALTRDGIVGPETWAALQAICGEAADSE